MLFATVWLALGFFVLAEAGKGPLAHHGQPAAWARPAWIVSSVLITVHTLLAFETRYDWNHETAVRETAMQGAAVYGLAWRGSLYVNYVFIALWVTKAWRWRSWLWRGFVLLMIVNGAIVFARPIARPWGALLVAVLVWAWLPRRDSKLRSAGYSSITT